MSSRPPLGLMNRRERLRWWLGQWRLGVPALVTLGLVALLTLPLPSPLAALPHLGLLAVFVWAMFQPDLMPPWLAFLLGVLSDALLGQPLGIDATLFPAAVLFVRLFEARFGRHLYGAEWALCAAVALAYALLSWQMLGFTGHPGALRQALVEAVVTVIAYPAVVALCAAVQRELIGRFE